VATYKRLKAIALQDRLKPTQAHAILHQYIGNWDAKMTFYQDGKESDVKMEGELEVGHLYNGLYTLFNMKYTKPAPMESMAILGIDPSTGQIRSAAIASLNSGNEHATFLRVGNNIVGFRAGYNELNGEWRYIRQVSTPVVAGEYTESLEELMKDGTWRKIGVTTFTKKQAGSEGG
ncbi:MAG: DUF1579 family protein, partial [Planctomycetes bacterium]|nr:DUF1579 family protein [Planctomycetota bacterium]